MKKGGFLRNVLDTIRSNQANPSGGGAGGSSSSSGAKGAEFGGQLKPQHFSLCQVARHGYPDQPSALAFDPVQKIAAIGTKTGSLRIFGRPGVDIWAQHTPEYAVTHIKFIVNQGAIITVTSDESIHLWSLRGPNLKLQLSSHASGSSSSTSPAQAPTTTASGHPHSSLTSTSPAQSSGFLSNSSASGQASSAAIATHHNLDSGAQPGDPDYLLAECGVGTGSGSSPTGDKISKQPEILHTLKFQREHITCLHQTLMSKWLYIGTERGNIHVVNVETFELSGYSIAWNKAIELSRKTHPGSIIHISECPQDSNKLLIGYESGCIVLWDLKAKNAEGRYYHTENLLWLAWHYEGKQFVAAHGDGSLATWQTRSNAKPAQILHPHAKSQNTTDENQAQPTFAPFGASTFARALNNELYRPINKVEWKTSKNNEQFLLFSGGLPYDGLDSQNQLLTSDPSSTRSQSTTVPPTIGLTNPLIGLQAAKSNVLQANQQQQQFLKACSSASPNFAATSPTSSAISPSTNLPLSSTRQSQQQPQQQKERKSLRSTSLTVMYGKSITVLEMDDTIIDFVTICDITPYENDTSDPFAVIVLLSNDLILIDLTSSGYPSFDSPYPSSQLNESPVTCVEYLADCSSDLIPFLYSNSQNVVSRAPKKGFSDKEWPINGGEWGQPMQSYPELVLTGHADGTIKFWDMSGVNFDLISKIKTSKLFERPNRLPNSVILEYNQSLTGNNKRRTVISPTLNGGNETICSPSPSGIVASGLEYTNTNSPAVEPIEENFFAIEKIEYCAGTKHLLVAGACSQIIQFKLNKKEQQSSQAGGGGGTNELTTIIVEPNSASPLQSASNATNNELNQSQLKLQQQTRQHVLLKAKLPAGSSSSSAGGSSSSSHSSQLRSRSNGFQVELICLTPMLVSSVEDNVTTNTANSNAAAAAPPTLTTSNVAYYCQAPPKVTALALQAAHSILAYSHENGIVLVDIIQKCIILNATLSDLYGCSPTIMSNNRDNINIQPFATSSILQHHYQSNAATVASLSSHSSSEFNTVGASGAARSDMSHNNSSLADNGLGEQSHREGVNDNSSVASLYKSATTTSSTNEQSHAQASSQFASLSSSSAMSLSQKELQQQQPTQPTSTTNQSRFPTSSMFQRQLSTTALLHSTPPASSGAVGVTSAGANVTNRPSSGGRLFQRQVTASQLFSSSTAASSSSSAQDNKQRAAALLAGARASNNPASGSDLTNSAAVGSGAASNMSSMSRSMRRLNEFQPSTEGASEGQLKKTPKNKRIISRMLSISAIQTTVGASFGASNSNANEHSASPGNNHNGSLHHQLHHHHHHHHHEGPAATSTTTANSTMSGDQVADKIDSSFTRSRSSSSSSTAPNEHHSQQQQHKQHSTGETIQCLCFFDWSQAMRASSSSSSSGSLVAATHSSVSATTSSSGIGSTPGGATSANNKSLSSIENPTPGQLALWLGTSQGCVLLVYLGLPDSEDNRVLQLQSVSAEPIPHATIKLSGSIQCLTTFTSERPLGSSSSASGAPLSGTGSLSTPTSSLESEQNPSATPTSTSSTALKNQEHPSGGNGCGSSSSFYSRISTFLAIVSEKQAKIYQIPTGSSPSGNTQQHQNQQNQQQQQQSGKLNEQQQHHHQKIAPETSGPDAALARLLSNKANCVSKIDLSDSSYACCSGLVQMRQPDECCLVSYLATGNLVVHSLPRMRPLMEADFVPYTNARISSSMRFSRNGHSLYRPSTSEISKFTISAQYKSLVNEMTGQLYVAREMPEMPRGNFFKSLFSVTSSVASKQSDRDELFGECSAGKASRNVAKYVGSGSSVAGSGGAISGSGSGSGGPSGLDKLKNAAVGTMGHDMRVAREGLDERGEKLSDIEDKTLQMMNSSETYAQAAHQLAQKFKDKKWYQF